MKEYHSIETVYKRDPETKYKRLLLGQYANPAFEYLANNEWVFTEKVDGTNIRIMCPQQDIAFSRMKNVSFGGKTDAAQLPATLVQKLQERFHTDEALHKLVEVFPEGNACLYGEGYGAKIQGGGGNYRPDQDFVLFDVKVGDFWLQRKDVEDVAQKLGLDVVPIIGTGDLHTMIKRAASGFTSAWGTFTAEGIVARPTCELKTRNGERVITKIKHRDFA